MKKLIVGAIVAATCLSACVRKEEAAVTSSPTTGRYIGLGIYSPSELWAKVSAAKASPDATAARLDDDDHIIVVVDSRTGEVRQCGNLSGYCITMNPWKAGAAGAPSSAPVALSAHATDLRQVEQSVSVNVAPAAP